MLKRTKSYWLLTLLVLTGFAGSFETNSLTGKERKILVADLKQTRKTLLQKVEGLNETQLAFRPNDSSWTVKECIYHIAISENNLWNLAAQALKSPANPDKRKEIRLTDEALVKVMQDRSTKYKVRENFDPKTAAYKTTEEALEDFKTKRAALVKFVKTSTDDMRSHVTDGPGGAVDVYQMLLMIAAHTNRHTQQIESILSHERFPK